MWSPTHIQVTVQKAKNLLNKGRKAGNDAFVLIQMGKEKFQTSVKEKMLDPEWHEECDLIIQENETNVTFTVFHRNMLGLDEFLGQVVISLDAFQSHDRPISKWYTLKGRSDKKESKYRGELEVRISYVVRSCDTQSLNDLSFIKKRRNSLKDFASSVGNKFQKMPSRRLSLHLNNFDPRASLDKLRKRHKPINVMDSKNHIEDEDFVESTEEFSQLKLRRTGSIYASTLSLPPSSVISSPIREDESLEGIKQADKNYTVISKSPDFPNGIIKHMSKKNEAKSQIYGQWTNKISSHTKESLIARSVNCLLEFPENDFITSSEKKSKLDALRNVTGLRRHTLHLSEAPDLTSLKGSEISKKGRFEILKSSNFESYSKVLPEGIPHEIVQEFDNMNHRDLVILAIKQQADIERQRDKILDLETYLDDLLVRVMETTPRILQISYKTANPACFR